MNKNMDVLSKLQEKNKAHELHDSNARWNTVWTVLFLSPLLFSYGLEFYYSFKGITFETLPRFFVLFGMLGFGLPLGAMGSLMLFNRSTKLVMMLICQSWFIWFWVIEQLSWLAFLPLMIAFIIVQIQMPKIKNQS
ncbi:hypothetical protein [Thalassotalea mangrovi]|uniref:Uncharacterized protein n=1 Tax=Thalassotalea mangrovi TaxID=2572245 RepID=A0A4U1B5I3_9GAMM|nr:hypothetical protein [Thalassotalea mangrovi]TKB45368.1 hypothetical protein E8M12_09230 [Thalassotalea mangrovi]